MLVAATAGGAVRSWAAVAWPRSPSRIPRASARTGVLGPCAAGSAQRAVRVSSSGLSQVPLRIALPDQFPGNPAPSTVLVVVPRPCWELRRQTRDISELWSPADG